MVFPTKYRRIVINTNVDNQIKNICLEIAKRYEIHFVEMGTDKDHVHFLIQSTPTYSVVKLVTIIKSITAKKVFEKIPELKEELWGSSLWSSGYYVSTIGKHGNEHAITQYVKEQGRATEYQQVHKDQLVLF